MRTGCGCLEIQHEPLEFKITTPVINLTKYSGTLPNTNEQDWCRLKSKIIADFLDIVKKLECGIQPDIEILLEEISLIYMNSDYNFNVTKQMYFSNPEDEVNYLTKENYLTEFKTTEERYQVLNNLGVLDYLRDFEIDISTEGIKQYLQSKILEVANQLQDVSNTVEDLNEFKENVVPYTIFMYNQSLQIPIKYTQYNNVFRVTRKANNFALIIEKFNNDFYVRCNDKLYSVELRLGSFNEKINEDIIQNISDNYIQKVTKVSDEMRQYNYELSKLYSIDLREFVDNEEEIIIKLTQTNG